MSSDVLDEGVRDGALAAVVARYPTAMLTALAPDGFMMPMPPSVGLPPERVIPLPPERCTMLDLIMPADHFAIIDTWDQAHLIGATVCRVHARSEPDRPLTLTFIDVRHSHGVFIGVLTEPDATTDTEADDRTPLAALTTPGRPRSATIRKTWQSVMIEVDDRATRMLGWTAEQLIGVKSSEFLHPDDRERALTNWMELLANRDSQRVRLRHRCADGSYLWIELENIYQPADDPTRATVLSLISDISDEMAAHEALGRQATLLHRLTESLPIGVLQVRADGSPAYANPRLRRILGVEAAATMAEQLSTVVHADRMALAGALDAAVSSGLDQELEIEVRLPDTGAHRRCAVAVVAVTDQDGAPGALACLSDITDSARLRDELRVRATYDSLTGCLNRASILAVLDQALGDATGPGLTGVIFIDLDGFKPINDVLGHAVGDEVLVRVAARLGGAVRGEDAVGRIGGDEFLVISRHLSGPGDVDALADRIRTAICAETSIGGHPVQLAASIGVTWSGSGLTSDALIAQADAAMYESKRDGRGRPVSYAAVLAETP
jgi:diguanylate cyclase (GGDEF)-like protein/PAS domain S-box-containing protein